MDIEWLLDGDLDEFFIVQARSEIVYAPEAEHVIRTYQHVEVGERVQEIMTEFGLAGEDLDVYVMAERPSNVFLADRFAERFDGFSIGTNDLTQLVLGVDRNSERLAYLFDENDEAVRRAVRSLIEEAHAPDRPVGICGDAPSTCRDTSSSSSRRTSTRSRSRLTSPWKPS
jgi:phosphoenolpyruvate synthase/pyruvate phosphate dikinase